MDVCLFHALQKHKVKLGLLVILLKEEFNSSLYICKREGSFGVGTLVILQVLVPIVCLY